MFFVPIILLSEVNFGIDVLREQNYDILKGKKVGLVANHASRDKYGNSTLELLRNSEKVDLRVLFTPEHGYYTTVPAGEAVKNDTIMGIPALSLYGESKKPDGHINELIDVIVIDIQDIGVRSYTYLSTMYNTMQVAASKNIPVIVLDRANPLGGMIVDGNVLEEEWKSFVGIIPISYIHGCTFGELAEMINRESWLGNNLKCELTVIGLENWKRWMIWEDLDRAWYPTSPHVPTINSVRGIATIGIFGELGFISIGIGTTLPFQYVGFPGMTTQAINLDINKTEFKGLKPIESKYRPFYGMYNGKYCDGFLLQFDLSNDFKPYSEGISLMLDIRHHYPELFQKANLKPRAVNMFNKVTGTENILNSMFNNLPDDIVFQQASKGLYEFIEMRDKYLLY